MTFTWIMTLNSSCARHNNITECCMFTELDALGDDLALDEDTSYLDEAEKAPTVPDTDLPEPSANKVKYYLMSLSSSN